MEFLRKYHNLVGPDLAGTILGDINFGSYKFGRD